MALTGQRDGVDLRGIRHTGPDQGRIAGDLVEHQQIGDARAGTPPLEHAGLMATRAIPLERGIGLGRDHAGGRRRRLGASLASQ